MNVAVIGAGLSGLCVAERLAAHCPVSVFEKSRGVSGRTSTRYGPSHEFDHGAQYFTIRGARFRSYLQPFIGTGQVARWEPRMVSFSGGKTAPLHPKDEMWVATPRMNSLAKAVSERFLAPESLHIGAKVTDLQQDVTGWRLKTDKSGDFGPFSHVILAIPARQAVEFLGLFPALQRPLGDVTQTGCYTIMLGSEEALDLGYDAATIEDSPLGWLAVNSSKPGRGGNGTALVVQSTNLWAEAHIDEDVPAMESLLLQELERVSGIDPTGFSHIATHRWRYADTARPLGRSHLFDSDAKIGICGDWCIRGRVEAAFDSAMALADEIIASIQ